MWTEVAPQLVNNQPFLYEFDVDMTAMTVARDAAGRVGGPRGALHLYWY